MTFSRVLLLSILLSVFGATVVAQTAPRKIQWKGRDAYLLTNGNTEAVIVPALSGRLMVLRFVGGTNVLWNSPNGTVFKKGEWANWGGEKVWPSPQSDWALFNNPAWPPHQTYDGLPHRARVLSGRRLETVGPVMAGWGVRARRVIAFDPATGELVISTTFTKVAGEPRFIAAWNVVQVPPPDVIYIPSNPNSPYRDSVYWFDGATPKQANKTEVGDDGLIAYKPSETGGYKLGFDTTIANAAAAKGNLALILRSTRKNARYPEGAEGSGFPITLWNNGSDTPALRYNEIEVLSPLTNLRKGWSFTHVLRLHLLHLPNSDPTSSPSRVSIAAALKANARSKP